MPIPATQITQVEIIANGIAAAGGSNNKKFEFVFAFRRTSNVNPLVKANIETAFQTAIMIPVTNALNNRYAQTFNTVRYLNDALDAPVPVARAVAGAIAGDGMPMHNAAYLLARTGLRGRSYKGGKHFGPLSEADTTAGTEDILNAASLILWGLVATAWLAGFTDANGNVWAPCILSRTLSQLTANPTNVVTNDVTQILINKRVGRMRHREVQSVY
jgi:hypothetical protein